MLKSEFEQLTGRTNVDEEIFNEINAIYEMTDLDKQVFCKSLERDGKAIIADLAKRVRQLRKAQERYRELCEKVIEATSEQYEDDELYQIAANAIGRNDAIRYKLIHQLKLSRADELYVLGILR